VDKWGTIVAHTPQPTPLSTHRTSSARFRAPAIVRVAKDITLGVEAITHRNLRDAEPMNYASVVLLACRDEDNAIAPFAPADLRLF
jgi:hypothetical protein